MQEKGTYLGTLKVHIGENGALTAMIEDRTKTCNLKGEEATMPIKNDSPHDEWHGYGFKMMSETERLIWKACSEEWQSGEEIVLKAGFAKETNHLKSIMSNMVERGILEAKSGQGFGYKRTPKVQ